MLGRVVKYTYNAWSEIERMIRMKKKMMMAAIGIAGSAIAATEVFRTDTPDLSLKNEIGAEKSLETSNMSD